LIYDKAECPRGYSEKGNPKELVARVSLLVDRVQQFDPGRVTCEPDRDEAAERALNAAIDAEQRIVELQQRITQLEKLAMTDELTGLLNRRGFEAQLQRTLALSNRHCEPGLLVYVDMDGFKMVNDTYGHPAGDEVLRQVGRLLSDNVRCTDFVGRLGGDEFAALLPRTSWQNGMKRVSALNQLLNPATIYWNGGTLAVHASVGVHAYDGNKTGDVVGLLALADSSMYVSKRHRAGESVNRMAV
jgi:diguanylate cyclase (GGDEF)-like protein